MLKVLVCLLLAEEWRPCPCAPTRYMASSNGRVCGSHGARGKFRVLSPTLHGREGREYLRVSFCINYKKKRKPVHQFVAEAFYGPRPFAGAQVRHLNGNRFDNRACNLAWGTVTENRHDRSRHGRD